MSNLIRARSWFPKAWSPMMDSADCMRARPVAAGQTFYKGDWLQIDTAGRLIYAAAGVGSVYGIAMQDSIAQAVDTLVIVCGAATDIRFIMQNKAGVASSGLVPGKFADLYVSGSGATRIPQLDGAAPVRNIFLIDALVPDDDTSDTTNPGRAYFKVVKSQFLGT